MSTRERNARAVPALYPTLVLLGASMLWGLTWMPLKHFGTFGIEGVVTTLFAHGSVGVLALPFLALRRKRWAHRALPLLLLAVLGGTANVAFAAAIVQGDVVRVMVLFYLLPAWGVLGGWAWLGERVDGVRSLSVVCALAGAFLVIGGVNVLAQPPTGTDVVALLSGLTLAMNNVLFRRLSDVDVPSKVATVFVGCLCCALVTVFAGVQTLPSAVPAGTWLQVIAFGTVWILLATLGTLWAVAHMEAGRSSVLMIVELLTAVLTAALFSETRLSLLEWLGGALIVTASLLEAWRPAAEEPRLSEHLSEPAP